MARTDSEGNSVRRELAWTHIIERGDTAAALLELEALGLEPDPAGCSRYSFAYLRRQFDRYLQQYLGGGRGLLEYFMIGRLADRVGASTTREIYADSLRWWGDTRIDYMSKVEHGQFRWPLSTGTVALARSHALRGDSAAAAEAACRAKELFAPRNDVRDMGRLAKLTPRAVRHDR